MSLINQMLADLEARRGGRLDSSARALEGLQPVYLALPARADGALRLLLAAGAGAALVALAWYGLQGFTHSGASLASPLTPTPIAAVPAPTAAAPDLALVAPGTLIGEHLPGGSSSSSAVRDEQGASDGTLRIAYAASSAAVDAAATAELPEPEASMTADATTSAPAPVATGPAAAPLLTDAPASPTVEYRGTVRLDRHVDPDDPAQALAGILPRLQGPGQTRALRDLERLVARAPAYLPARQALASELLRSRQTAAAERVLRAGLVTTPQAPRLAELLAHLLVARGDVAGALAALHKARAAANGDGDYAAFIAALEQRVGRHAEAVTSFRAALATAPGRGAWWAGLAISLAAQGLADAAREAYGRALADAALPANLRRYAERERARLPGAG